MEHSLSFRDPFCGITSGYNVEYEANTNVCHNYTVPVVWKRVERERANDIVGGIVRKKSSSCRILSYEFC